MVVLSVLLIATGCSTVIDRPATTAGDDLAPCGQLFRALDLAAEGAGVRDGGSSRVAGFPYLRTDRFLASYRGEPMDRAQEAMWIGLMRALDTQARSVELANLPERYRAGLDLSLLNLGDPKVGLARCAEELVRRELSNPDATAALRRAVEVPDEYQTWKRVVGLYPLSALAFLQGVSAYHTERHTVFAMPLDDLSVEGRLLRYEPPPAPVEDAESLRVLLARARDNPLQIPLPGAAALSRLIAAYAPVLEVDRVGRSDQIGVPMFGDGGRPDVDVADPTVFVRVAHTRYAGEPLLQLVYSVWFPERPRTGAFDLLGGRLDGITWRVTLDADGEPLLYDSMHNCGCYHMFFPTDRLRLREVLPALEEPILVGTRLASWRPGERAVLRIAAGTHYLQNVRHGLGSGSEDRQRYTFAPDDQLRSLQGGDASRRSLFRPDGIVPGTQRRERYVFWPMGVREPGAMRQWGRHATAFVGRRHFDDPYLIERYFESFQEAVR